MILFKTTEQQILRLASIKADMKNADISCDLIEVAAQLARLDQGVYDLMELWVEASNDPQERDEIIIDIQKSIDDYKNR